MLLVKAFSPKSYSYSGTTVLMLMTARTISSKLSVLMERSNNADNSKIIFHWLWNTLQRDVSCFYFAAAVAAANLPFQLYKMFPTVTAYSWTSTNVIFSILPPTLG